MMKPGRLHGTAFLAGALAASAAGCGHRGDPLPPRRHTPPGLAEFRLAQRGEALEVSLLTPVASIDGLPIERLVVEILYAQGEQNLEKAGERRELVADPRQRVFEELPLPPPETVARAAARGIVGREKGQRTLTLALVAQSPVAPPRELAARLVEGGVELAWQGEVPEPVSAVVRPPRPLEFLGPRPADAPPGLPRPAPGAESPPPAESPAGSRPDADEREARPRPDAAPTVRPQEAGSALSGSEEDDEPRSGFHLYRRVGTERYLRPLAPGLLAEALTVDATAPLGARACYVVRAAASVEPLVESAPSNEVCLEVRDIEPPGAPTGLAVLPRERGLEVLFTPSPEADLAGYRVYRSAAGEPRARLAELQAQDSSWLDTNVRAGVAYFYEVTAFDRSGNEGPPARAAETSLP